MNDDMLYRALQALVAKNAPSEKTAQRIRTAVLGHLAYQNPVQVAAHIRLIYKKAFHLFQNRGIY